jgi:hypothetical protein
MLLLVCASSVTVGRDTVDSPRTLTDPAAEPTGAILSVLSFALVDATDRDGLLRTNPGAGRTLRRRQASAPSPTSAEVRFLISKPPQRSSVRLYDIRGGSPSATLVDTAPAIGPGIIPDVYLDKVDELPDYYQRNGAYGGFPRGGSVYCGPAAVSNSIIWLADNGYPDLVPSSGDRARDQHGTIAELASRKYMGLGWGGIGPNGLARGLTRYIADKGYGQGQLLYQGWRRVAAEFRSGVAVPDIDSLKAGTIGMRNAYLNVGWYDHDRDSDTWTRTGGHWVAVVGYGHDGTGVNPDCLVVHDPASGSRFNEYWELVELTGGTMAGNYSGLPRAATGFHRIEGRNAIVDCIVVLTMPSADSVCKRGR